MRTLIHVPEAFRLIKTSTSPCGLLTEWFNWLMLSCLIVDNILPYVWTLFDRYRWYASRFILLLAICFCRSNAARMPSRFVVCASRIVLQMVVIALRYFLTDTAVGCFQTVLHAYYVCLLLQPYECVIMLLLCVLVFGMVMSLRS